MSMIWVYDNIHSLSQAAAGLFSQLARQAVQDHGKFSVALSGGHTPCHTYELLASEAFYSRIPWAQVHVFWGDERCVPPDDPRSNARMARQAFLSRVPIPPDQIHPISCAQKPAEAGTRYEAVLRGFFGDQSPRFDLILLGLGENGHTASLFPNTSVLEEEERWVAEVYVAEQKMHRVTLTAPFINQAAAVAFLVAGAGKSQVLRQVLKGPSDPKRLPAQLIRPTNGQLMWLVDKEAASLISRAA
jgi:6-phosphogluconolactonase